MSEVIAYKIGKDSGKADGGPVFALLGTDGKYYVGKHCSFSKECCEELKYKPIKDKNSIVLDGEQLTLTPPSGELMENWKTLLNI